jgi:SAM-dependent methyltransferase
VNDFVQEGVAGSRTYSLGHSERELERLSIQARLIEPITRRYFVEAGIGAGMRVLDVGSGAGDVAFLAAEFVGPSGEVVGTDRGAAALETARQRAKDRSLPNVTFVEGDPAELTFAAPFDAVVGRYVLMFQPDPAAMLRKVAGHARSGGVVVFHESCREGVRSYPPVPTYDRFYELVSETFRRTGADPLMGLKLHATFLAAGLPAPTMRMESVLAGGASSSDHVHLEMDLAETLALEMQRAGIATTKDDFATLAERVLSEVITTNSVVVGRSDVGAWAHT